MSIENNMNENKAHTTQKRKYAARQQIQNREDTITMTGNLLKTIQRNRTRNRKISNTNSSRSHSRKIMAKRQ